MVINGVVFKWVGFKACFKNSFAFGIKSIVLHIKELCRNTYIVFRYRKYNNIEFE